MALLHGSWLVSAPGSPSEPAIGGLFLWGEVWRRLTPDLGDRQTENGVVNELVEEGGTAIANPFALSPTELEDFLQTLDTEGKLRLPKGFLQPDRDAVGSAKGSGKRLRSSATTRAVLPALTGPWQTHTLALPSEIVAGEDDGESAATLPRHSAASPPEPDADIFLHPWQVTGLWLSPVDAIAVLNALPLSFMADQSFMAGDLRYWSHIARWSLDLLARAKFLPHLEKAEELSQAQSPENSGSATLARWHPLLDSATDQLRWLRFSESMPLICRFSVPGTAFASALPLPADPQGILQDFLNQTLDVQMRAIAQAHPVPMPERSPRSGVKSVAIATPLREWLQALGAPTATVAANGTIESLQAALHHWTAPLQNQRQQTIFRTCLKLVPPQYGQSTWTLEYFLQAIDDSDFLVTATTIWGNPVERLMIRGRAIVRPQETFLMGLGLASRLYAPMEASLQASRPQFCKLTALQAYEFIKSATWRLEDSGLGVVLPPGLANQNGWANRLGLKIQAQTGTLKKGDKIGLQNLLNFRWELSIGGQSVSKEEFDRLVALNMPLVQINDEWVELRPQDIKAAQTFFASRKDQPALSLEDALRISTGDTQMIEKLPVVSFEASGSLQELLNTLNGNRTVEAIATPASFRGELRPYQARGVGWLKFLEQWSLGACLADDMGLGKTIQLIAFLLTLQEAGSLTAPVLLICPTSVLGNWEREVKKFGPTLRVQLHHGDKRPQGKALAKAVRDQQLVITSYALVHRDLESLKAIAWQGVVLDEAQNVKNPDAKQSQAVRQLPAQFRIALTGTPVENRLAELWSILDFLNPGYLGPKNFFQRRFATPIERYGDTASLQTLRSLVQPFILRRLKSDRDIIQDLPEKQEMTVFCGLTTEQAALYQKLVDQSLVDIESAAGIQRKGIILGLIVKLKQICNHPSLFLKDDGELGSLPNGDRADIFPARSGKVQRLEEMLEEVVLEGDRALIFTQFAEWGKLLQAHLERRLGQKTLFLYGSTSKKQREEMVDRFQHDPQGPRIFILSLKAGGVGLNLTRANHVFHFDRWWNPAVENQATDRVFRIGQTRNVQVHKFVCNGTLEEKIHDLIESKKALAEQVVGAGENWLTEMDTDQLRNLLLLDRSVIIGED
jgi:SNF2 family DNA or RNA helicase